jgi:hypothetical protein
VSRTLSLLAVLVALGAAPAEAHVAIGIGDQKPYLYVDPRFSWLGIRYTRIVVSWQVEHVGWERPWVDKWLADARRDGVQPLVGFGHAWSGPARRALPSVAQYRAAVSQFHRRYPWVRDYIAWNEANHCSQPTCHHPERAAAYFDVLTSVCPTCDVVAADVLDQPNMVPWLRAFRRAVRHRPKLWGLHNYLDVNRLRSTGTRRFLATVRGPVWITETGGVVHRRHYRKQIAFEESPAHAAEATSYLLHLATALPRIRRVYIYQWSSDSPDNAWDSGLVDYAGNPRPAFAVLARFLGRDPGKAPGPAPPPASSSPPPPADPPPSSPSPPPPACSLPPPLCTPPAPAVG